ncbi:hypothetical protein BDN70DRAFT_660247 [Pholiota conissans]|uniref:Uncharacterized protein n=1 Tax=Pholiota conissans TaxID=109636 RepID=A0A9P5Z5K7_9AGAR|nr:hypothetical protein BDN70DRAFT_660247 [Pholiota conissans]
MHIFRAGLFAIAITIALCTSLTSGVPLPIASSLSNKHSISSVSRTTQLRHHVGSHAPVTNERAQRTFAIKKQPASLSESDGVPSPDIVGLERRNIFSKIKKAFKKIGHGIKHAFQKVGKGIKKVAKKVGSGIKKVAKKVGGGIKKVAKKVGRGIKKVAKKVGHGIKTAAKKVGHFVKTTGAKIAKVGLKVWSTAQKLASKVVQFIPVVGKPLSKVLDGASAVTNAASNAIHAKIGGKLGKAMKVMDKTRKIAGYIPRELPEDALEERELEELDARYDYLDDVDVTSREVYDDDSVFYARDWNEFGVGEF